MGRLMTTSCLVSVSPSGDRKIQVSQEQSLAQAGTHGCMYQECSGSGVTVTQVDKVQYLVWFFRKTETVMIAPNPHRTGRKLRDWVWVNPKACENLAFEPLTSGDMETVGLWDAGHSPYIVCYCLNEAKGHMFSLFVELLGVPVTATPS